MDVKPVNLTGLTGTSGERGGVESGNKPAVSVPVSPGGESFSVDRVSISEKAQRRVNRASVADASRQSSVESSAPVVESQPHRHVSSSARPHGNEKRGASEARAVTRELERQVAQSQREQERSEVLELDAASAEIVAEMQVIDARSEREKTVRAMEYAHARKVGRRAQIVSIRAPSSGEGAVEAPSRKLHRAPPASDAAATIRKMEQVKRAALGSDEPSPRDRTIALRAEAIQTRARREMVERRRMEHGNDIGIGADAASPVIEAARGQVPNLRGGAPRTDAQASEASEEPGSISASEATNLETPLLPILEPLRSYKKNVEAVEERPDTKSLKDVLV